MAAARRCGRHASQGERLQHWGTYFAQFSTHRLVGTTACNLRPQPAALQLLGYFAKPATHTYKATCIEQSCAAAGAKHVAQRVSVSTDTSTAAGDNAARLESPSPRPSPGPTDSPAPVLVVDGTNLLMQCRADRGWGVSHAEAFEAWLQSLQRLTRAGPTYVVFDNKRGKAAGDRGGPGRGNAAASAAAGAGVAVAVQEERRAVVPGYLDKRHAKGGRGGSQSGSQGVTGGAAAAEQKRSDILPVGISSASRHEPQAQSRPGPGAGPVAAAAGAGAGAHSSPGPPQPRHSRLPEAECLMDVPPSHLAPFVAAIRRAGGLALYGIPGLEADDLIASLTAGLLTLPLPPPPKQQQQPDLAAGQQHQQQQQQQEEGQHQQRQEQQQGAQAGPATAALAAPPPLRVLVASGDADMLQLLALPGVAWLELRQLSRAASAQEPPQLAVSVSPALVAFGHTQSPTLGVMGAAVVGPGSELLRLHQAASSSLGAGTEPVGSAASGSAPQQLLPPAAYPDLLALVGKPEAGVVGAGVSAKSARKLLLRYGSVEGLARACDDGELDDALRLTPLGNARASACVRAGHAAAPGEGPATTTSAAPSGAGGGSGSGCKEGGARQSQAVQRALCNVRVTRMRTDLSTVPWGRVQAYQQERQLQRAELDSGQAPTAPLGSTALAALPLSLPLHPHDAMHAASAAPYVAALAAALAARGLACRVSHMGPRAGLVDLSLTLSVQPSGLAAGPGAAAAVVGGGEGRGESSGVGRMAAAGASGAAGARALQGLGLGGVSAAAVERVASELARLAGSAAGAAGAGVVADDGDGGRNAAGSRDTGVSGRAASSPGADAAPGCLGPLNRGSEQAPTYVCVLSPWDFDADAPALQKARGGVGKGGNGSDNGSTNSRTTRNSNGSNSGGSDTGSGPQAFAASTAASSEACSRTDPHARLAALASSLRRAAGPRQSLCKTPNALRALLRPTSAWRLKGLQRVLAGGGNAGAGGDVQKPSGQGAGRANALAVVPFYELLQAEVTGPDSVLI